MRSVLIIGLAVFGFTQNAAAADPAEYDVPELRGSNAYEPPAYKTYTRWNGFYAGGHVEYGSAGVDFKKATQSLVAFSLRETFLENEQHPSQWQVLGRNDTGSTGFGGFVGYNTQWEDIIVGIEANYSRNGFNAVAPSFPLRRGASAGGNSYDVTVAGAASLNFSDYGTLRGRVGYAIGNFLPYVTLGFALARVDFDRASAVTGTETPSGSTVRTPFTFTNSETKSSAFVGGWAIGAGLDVLIWQNLFARGEVEYLSFAPLSGIQASIVTGRLGAGLKF